MSALTLYWVNNSSNADGIQIERATSLDGPWSNIATVSGNATNYSDADVSCGVAYYYRVRAYNQAGVSGYSNISGPATLTCSSSPDSSDLGNNDSTFRILGIAREGVDIRVTWSAVGGERYHVEVGSRVDGTMPVYFRDLSPMIVMSGTAASTTNYLDVGGATKSTARFYRVRHVTDLLSTDDTDGDGLPDSWEMRYFGTLSHTGAEDSDGDGFSNKQEFLAGTDPTNGASYFRILAITKEKNDIRVTWMMGAGKTNVLQVANGPLNNPYSANDFTDLFTVTNSIGTVTNFLDVGGATNSHARFYQVRLAE